MKTLFYSIPLAVLCACATPLRIYTDYDPDFDQWHYTSYAIQECDGGSTGSLDSIHQGMLKHLVTNELEKRGYTPDHGMPGFLIRYYFFVDDHTVVSPALGGYFLGPFWMRTRTHKYIDKDETIVLDMVDVTSGHVVWKGWVKTTYHSRQSKSELARILRKSVSVMFRDFPRSSGKPFKSTEVVNK